MEKYNPVGWFEIYVTDIKKAQKFYEEVFGINMLELPNSTGGEMQMVAFPMHQEDVSGASGALVKMEGVKSGGNSTVVYFSSLDCEVEEGRVEDAGGKIHKSKMSIGEHGFMSLCFDAEGNMFGIHSMK